MNEIELKIFLMILSQVEVMIGFNRFCAEHEFITNTSLINYLYRGMRPTPKKYKYIIDCLKKYHAEEYEIMKNNIEKKFNKTVNEMIEEGAIKAALKRINYLF